VREFNKRTVDNYFINERVRERLRSSSRKEVILSQENRIMMVWSAFFVGVTSSFASSFAMLEKAKARSTLTLSRKI